MTCFWCGKSLGFFHAPIIVCGIPYKIHNGWFNNCATKYKEWHDRPKEVPIRFTLTH